MVTSAAAAAAGSSARSRHVLQGRQHIAGNTNHLLKASVSPSPQKCNNQSFTVTQWTVILIVSHCDYCNSLGPPQLPPHRAALRFYWRTTKTWFHCRSSERGAHLILLVPLWPPSGRIKQKPTGSTARTTRRWKAALSQSMSTSTHWLSECFRITSCAGLQGRGCLWPSGSDGALLMILYRGSKALE